MAVDVLPPGDCRPAGNSNAEPSSRNSSAATGASAASARAVAARMVAFYFRAPAKAFFRTRVDYLAFARAINPRVQAQESWSLRVSTFGLIGHAVRTYGWGFIPNQLLPPLLANITVGAVLYTSYLQFLARLHRPSSESVKRAYPPPPVLNTFVAGFSAGIVQSVVALPLDALHVRFRTSELLDGRYKNMWQYGSGKLKQIGLRGICAGWSLSVVKDSLGFGVFFATFEYVKAQAFYAFVKHHYRATWTASGENRLPTVENSKLDVQTIRPHYALEPAFLTLAGISATILQQLVQYPLSVIQDVHFRRVQSMDEQFRTVSSSKETMQSYRNAYRRTFKQCLVSSRRFGGWRRYLYRGFLLNTMKQVPATSAGLVIFEVVRKRFAEEREAVRLDMDGIDIILA